MRTVFLGASSLAVMTVRLLLNRGHEVVIITHGRNIPALTERWASAR